MLNRRELLKASAFGAMANPAWVSDAVAQQKALMILVGYTPGGPVDVVARAVAEQIRKPLDRQVLVDSKPGAGGQFPLAALRQAPTADGSLYACVPPSPITIFPSTYSKLPYDPAKDLMAVTTACTFEFALAVGPEVPARTVSELMAYCRSNPKAANLGVAGLGTTPHFLGYLLARRAGISLEPIAYKNAPQMAQEAAAGQVTCTISPVANFAELHRAGKLRILATSGARRSAQFPEVPTFTESGFAELQCEEWFAFFTKAGTPEGEVDRFAKAVHDAVASASIQQSFAAMGYTAIAKPRALLETEIKSDTARWAEVVRRTGFRADS